MTREPYKRSRRNPLTSEEVSHIIAHKKKKELVILRKLKKSKEYKFLNIFNILCIFIYLELLFCYFGPCHYQTHKSEHTITRYGSGNRVNGKSFIAEVDIHEAGGKIYKLIVEECIDRPAKTIEFIIGQDFLLQKELKGSLPGSEKIYRLFSASPVLFLCVLMTFISFFGFVMDLNENVYTLMGLSVLNFLTLFTILTIS